MICLSAGPTGHHFDWKKGNLLIEIEGDRTRPTPTPLNRQGDLGNFALSARIHPITNSGFKR